MYYIWSRLKRRTSQVSLYDLKKKPLWMPKQSLSLRNFNFNPFPHFGSLQYYIFEVNSISVLIFIFICLLTFLKKTNSLETKFPSFPTFRFQYWESRISTQNRKVGDLGNFSLPQIKHLLWNLHVMEKFPHFLSFGFQYKWQNQITETSEISIFLK